MSPKQPHIIQPTAVYTAEQVQRLLGLRPSTLRTAKREQGLRCCRRANRDWYLGEDLLAWLRGGRCSRGEKDQVEGSSAMEREEAQWSAMERQEEEATDG